MTNTDNLREFRAQWTQLADPEIVQREILVRKVVAPNTTSEYGRKHDFASIRDVRDFQLAVPVSRYEDIRSYVERMTLGESGVLVSEPVRRFFLTSGSVAAPKYIPVTASFIRDKWRAFQMYWGMVRRDHPGTARGSVITNFSDGSRESLTSGGLPCGSESSFWNSWGRGPNAGVGNGLPHEVCRIPDSQARNYCLARILLEQDVSVMMTLNPSTILLLLQTIDRECDSLLDDIEQGGLSKKIEPGTTARHLVQSTWTGNPDRAKYLRTLAKSESPRLSVGAIWPNMKVVICWRSPMVRPYLDLLTSYLGTVPQRDYILMASEGVIAIPFEDGVSGGALAVNIHFYEFIPEELAEDLNPPTLLAHELEPGHKYVVVLSTSSGLYRYNLGDVVNVRGFLGRTPVIEFLHRSGDTCSLTGEKLTEAQVAEAVAQAASLNSAELSAFTMCPVFKPFPHYALVVEFSASLTRHTLERLIHDIDRRLCSINLEYKVKRGSQRLGPPELFVVPSGSYSALRRRRSSGRTSESQIKLASLTRDDRFPGHFEVVETVQCAA